MGRWFMLMLLGLTEATLHQLVPSNDPKFFTGSGGQVAMSITLGDDYPDEAYPVIEWSASAWMYETTDGGYVIQTHSPFVSISWFGTTLSTYDGTASTSKTVKESFQNKWVFCQIGSTSSITYFVATVRGADQYFASSTVVNQLTLASKFKLLQTCGQITVITK